MTNTCRNCTRMEDEECGFCVLFGPRNPDEPACDHFSERCEADCPVCTPDHCFMIRNSMF